ncbi:MAG: hypothetical protein C4523_19680 [Myxococcales bacterium]|nr:MAG: hypothetical protein C4523_19680 [Myxococcales bacterium]
MIIMKLDALRRAIEDLCHIETALARMQTRPSSILASRDAKAAWLDAELTRVEQIVAAARAWDAARTRWDSCRNQWRVGEVRDCHPLGQTYEDAQDGLTAALAELEDEDGEVAQGPECLAERRFAWKLGFIAGALCAALGFSAGLTLVWFW